MENNQITQTKQELNTELPRVINSLCPECKKVIKAKILEEDGKIVMKKKCPEHGDFYDVVYNHAELFKKIEKTSFDYYKPLTNEKIKNAVNCPQQCGLCNMHQSRACMTNIDLTNRCNLRCPICFANANVQGYVYELTLEQVKNMLQNIIKQNSPLETLAVQFSGGEPTIHPRFLECIKAARDMGFTHVQIASNGITIANDLEFAKKCKENGLHTVYLQFDGVGEDAYKKTRGVKIWETKKKAIENCRKSGLKVILVPALVKTINEDQTGKILQFAIDNADIISGISYQPVAFTGRISEKQRLKQRYTLSDLAYYVEEQTDYAKAMEDWYPLNITLPFSKFISDISDNMTIHVSCHSNCGIGTYLFVNKKTKKTIPITQIIDVENMTRELDDFVKHNKIHFKPYQRFMFLYILRKNIKKDIKGLNLMEIYRLIHSVVFKTDQREWKLMLVAGMHFQDCYNYNVDRVKKCVIHYSAPNGLIYPFCTYNSGPVFREPIEKKYSIPLKEWKEKQGTKYVTSDFYKGDKA